MTNTNSIVDTAKYLRNVRPIDPDEIYEYVDGTPHPAVVRETLRQHAFELGVVETEDGRFVPVEEGPIEPNFDGVDRFPDVYARRFEELLLERDGRGWPSSDAGTMLRERIDRLKVEYFADESVTYDEETAYAYALYHLPDYYAAIQYVLDELGQAGLLSRTIRILDVGAGAGGPALGIHDYFPDDSLIEYDAVEPSASADILEAMLTETRIGFNATVHRETAEAFEPDGEYDLIVFANVLSELASPVDVLNRYLDALSPGGTVIAISPAEERTATRLRSIERALLDRRGDVTVYSPTIRLWPEESPTDRGWTFTRKPDIEPPSFQQQLDQNAPEGPDGGSSPGDGTYAKSSVQFAYALLRTDGRRAIEYEPNSEQVAKMAETERHVTERIDIEALKLSPDLSDGGNPIFKISDGSERTDHYAVLTNESVLNDELRRAPYGSLLHFENVLVLWNDDENAYNLVVDDETVVDRLT